MFYYTTGGVTTKEVYLNYEYLHLDPIGLFFMLFFAAVLFLQLIGMLFHRVMTLGHIISTTPIKFKCGNKKKSVDPNEIIQKRGVDMIRALVATYEVIRELCIW